MQVADKHKACKGLTALSKNVSDLADLGKAQVDLCASDSTVHQQLDVILSRILSNATEVSRLFSIIGTSLNGSEREAAQAVNLVLAIVCDTVELLKVADKYTVMRLENMATELASLSTSVAVAKDMDQLKITAPPLARLAVDVAKLASQRAGALDDQKICTSLDNAASVLAKHTSALIMAVRNSFSQGSVSGEVNEHKTAIHAAVHEINSALTTAPEFAVMFDVNYIDTELAAKLAALASAVFQADPINVSKHSKAVDAEVAKQLKLASADKTPATAEKCLNAQNAVSQVLSCAKEALAQRTAMATPAAPYLAAEKRLHAANNTLLSAVAALPTPNKQNSTTHLIKAAQDLSSKLQSLLY
jgi:hypothetical protein